MNIISDILIFAILIITVFAFGCGGNVQAEKNITNTKQSETQDKTPAEMNAAKSKKTATISVASVLGTYVYKTYKNGEGYDNSLEITDAGNGKIYVILSSSYNYTNNGQESSHKAENSGDGVLRENTAHITLVDDAEKSCRATIVFDRKTADLKILDACRINIKFDGIYKKISSKTQTGNDEPELATKSLTEIKYDKMMDMINDFDAHKVGEEFVITDIPPAILERQDHADEFGNTSYKNLFYLQGVTDDDTPSYSVLTSQAMIENLKQNKGNNSATLKMRAVIAESTGKFDVYRIPFVTKIEGLDEDGKAIWTAIIEKPAKIRFVH